MIRGVGQAVTDDDDPTNPRPIGGRIHLVDRFPAPRRLVDTGLVTPDEAAELVTFLKTCDRASSCQLARCAKDKQEIGSHSHLLGVHSCSKASTKMPHKDKFGLPRNTIDNDNSVPDQKGFMPMCTAMNGRLLVPSPYLPDPAPGNHNGLFQSLQDMKQPLTEVQGRDSPAFSLQSVDCIKQGPLDATASDLNQAMAPLTVEETRERKISVSDCSCDSQWMKKFLEWKDWTNLPSKASRGKAPVQTDFEGSTRSMSNWIKRQRTNKRKKDAGRPSPLTDEREQLLESHGFVWSSQAFSWDSRFMELCQFQEEHGHCRVPQKYGLNPKLGIWCKRQRRQHVLFEQGKKSQMTPQRIAKLYSIGFFFKPGMAILWSKPT